LALTPGTEEMGVEEEADVEAETDREGPGREREARTASMSRRVVSARLDKLRIGLERCSIEYARLAARLTRRFTRERLETERSDRLVQS
jgi:hypothetical protein